MDLNSIPITEQSSVREEEVCYVGITNKNRVQQEYEGTIQPSICRKPSDFYRLLSCQKFPHKDRNFAGPFSGAP